jgi:hypothetical protein
MAYLKRGVIVYDVDIDGSTRDTAKLDIALEEFSEGFKKFLKKKHPKLAKQVKFQQVKSAVPMQERRGPTGNLDEIVFRGTRGKNQAVGRVSLPVGCNDDEKRHIIAIRERLRRDKMPAQLIQQEVDREWMGIKSGSIPVKKFRKYIKKDISPVQSGRQYYWKDMNAVEIAMEDIEAFREMILNEGIKSGQVTIKIPREKIAQHHERHKEAMKKSHEIFKAMNAAGEPPERIQAELDRELDEAIQSKAS